MRQKTIACPDCGRNSFRVMFKDMEGDGTNRLSLVCNGCQRRIDFVVGTSKKRRVDKGRSRGPQWRNEQ